MTPGEKGELFRVDAKAEEDTVRIGGWSLWNGPDTKTAAWFSLQITREDCPWVFVKEPFRLVASLELLATLVGLMLLVPEGLAAGAEHGTVGIRGGTDNRGNSLAVDKWMSTKYPLCVVLMELAEQLHARNLVLRLGWLPREGNQPADDLTNEVWDRFDAGRRIRVQWKDLSFVILEKFMDEGAGFLNDVEVRKAARTAARPEAGLRRRLPLRARDPW